MLWSNLDSVTAELRKQKQKLKHNSEKIRLMSAQTDPLIDVNVRTEWMWVAAVSQTRQCLQGPDEKIKRKTRQRTKWRHPLIK